MNTFRKLTLLSLSTMLLLSSCVSRKKYNKLQGQSNAVQTQYNDCSTELANFRTRVTSLENDNAALKKDNDFLRQNNTTVLNNLQDLSVLSKEQAASVRQSLERLGEKDQYIQSLQSAMARKDSLNMALVMNLKGSLKDINDQDVEIKVDKGVVYVSISDKMLFNSGSSTVTAPARNVLGKVASVLNSHPEIEFIVEGHTDSVPIKTDCIQDNWDLSVKRATAVVRILQSDYKVDPRRVTAAGRSSYMPLLANDTPAGRASNRRTRIVIQPMLDQFFKLLEPGQTQTK